MTVTDQVRIAFPPLSAPCSQKTVSERTDCRRLVPASVTPLVLSSALLPEALATSVLGYLISTFGSGARGLCRIRGPRRCRREHSPAAQRIVSATVNCRLHQLFPRLRHITIADLLEETRPKMPLTMLPYIPAGRYEEKVTQDKLSKFN
jgi:hypothetical protein